MWSLYIKECSKHIVMYICCWTHPHQTLEMFSFEKAKMTPSGWFIWSISCVKFLFFKCLLFDIMSVWLWVLKAHSFVTFTENFGLLVGGMREDKITSTEKCGTRWRQTLIVWIQLWVLEQDYLGYSASLTFSFPYAMQFEWCNMLCKLNKTYSRFLVIGPYLKVR